MTKPALVYGPMFGSSERHASIRRPKCGEVAWIDRDQFMGRISMVCPNDECDYHETHDMRSERA